MKHTNLNGFTVLLFAVLFIGSCSKDQKTETEITWDSWCVPHIYAPNEEQLFYAQGWSQMQLHGNLVLTLYGRARGRAAEYWGKEFEREARLIHTLGFPELAKTWREKQDPRIKKLITAFVQGMNDYAAQHPAALEKDKQVVLPIVYDDINLHYLSVIYANFMAGGGVWRDIWFFGIGSYSSSPRPSRPPKEKNNLGHEPPPPCWGGITSGEKNPM